MVLTYEQIKAIPEQEQITQHYCIQGWSGIAKWGGVPMKEIVNLVHPLPQAKWAYEMNSETLNELHGAPLRLRNERELGFKHVKWIEAIEFVETFADLGAGQGGYNEDHKFYGYRESI